MIITSMGDIGDVYDGMWVYDPVQVRAFQDALIDLYIGTVLSRVSDIVSCHHVRLRSSPDDVHDNTGEC